MAVWVLVLLGAVGSDISVGACLFSIAERHSLYYIYTTLSKDVSLPGIYQFTALGLLDDREIDYYNSKEQKKIPKQSWMMEKMQEDYWEKGTQSRKSKEQWFKLNLETIMQRMNHSDQDLHVLQWRTGCEISIYRGEVNFVRGISEYGYDGSDFLYFNDKNMSWIAAVPEAEPTEKKWNEMPILNQYTQGYQDTECVDWLLKFLDYRKEFSPPDVHVFERKSVAHPGKRKLTCLATGFHRRTTWMNVKNLYPKRLITSSGVRPNGDGTYQLRKSLEIPEDDMYHYDCYVYHSYISGPIVRRWEKNCTICNLSDVWFIISVTTVVSTFGSLLFSCCYLVVTGRRRAKREEQDWKHKVKSV